jgi:tRNA threonylcarbamoyladenosine biosynthesis protein TsaB
LGIILHLETAHDFCSVALTNNKSVIAFKESEVVRSHASDLAVFIDDILKIAGVKVNDLDAVAVSKGPGSYTGLRIGVATAKGICYGINKPLIAINTLQAMACEYQQLFPVNSNELLMPMIDARRMEVYTALFDQDLAFIQEVKAEVLNENSVHHFEGKKIVLFGDGAKKTATFVSDRNDVKIVENYKLTVNGMIPLALAAFEKVKFEDIAYFEPYYLKEFVSNTTKA